MQIPVDSSDGGSSELPSSTLDDDELRFFADKLAVMEFNQLSAQATAPIDEGGRGGDSNNNNNNNNNNSNNGEAKDEDDDSGIGDRRGPDGPPDTDFANLNLVLKEVMDPNFNPYQEFNQYLPPGINWHEMSTDQLTAEKAVESSSSVEEGGASQAGASEIPNSMKRSAEPDVAGSPTKRQHMELDEEPSQVVATTTTTAAAAATTTTTTEKEGAVTTMEVVEPVVEPARSEYQESDDKINHLELFGEDPDEEMREAETHREKIQETKAQEPSDHVQQTQESHVQEIPVPETTPQQPQALESPAVHSPAVHPPAVENPALEPPALEQQPQHQGQATNSEVAYVLKAPTVQAQGQEIHDQQQQLYVQQIHSQEAQQRVPEDIADAQSNEEQPQPEVEADIDMNSEIPALRGGQPFDPAQSLKLQSLPVLENLVRGNSSQLLQTFCNTTYMDLLSIVTQPNSDQGQAYAILVELFSQTRRIYGAEPFLSTAKLKPDSLEHYIAIRKANLATYISSCFGSQYVGFFHLNEYFLDVFVPDGQRLLKQQGAIYLDLKTQSYISSLEQNEKSPSEILTDLFDEQMAEKLLAKRHGAKQPTPSEIDFLSRLRSRKEHLKELPTDDIESLRDKYSWHDFLREMVSYVSKNLETILHPQPRRPYRRHSPPSADHSVPDSNTSPDDHYMHGVAEDEDERNGAANFDNINAASQYPYLHQEQPSGDAAFRSSAERLGLGNEDHDNMALSLGAPPLATPPHPPQTTPTSVLYERARLAATARTSPNSRRAGLPSQRRPWTHEEENALMAGLDRVKGPHWSQILEMFGAGGTVSEALKDRNQVQLKDKARNLKLFFLKSGLDVPYYLQFVTGELKTRAPQQAAKNERRRTQEQIAKDDAANSNTTTVPGPGTADGAQSGDGNDAEEYSQEMDQDQEMEDEQQLPPQQQPQPELRENMEEHKPALAEPIAAA